MKTQYLIPCVMLFCYASISAQTTTSIQVKYDKFENRTSVALWDMPLAGAGSDIKLSLSHSFIGPLTKRINNPSSDKVLIVFSAEREIETLGVPPAVVLLLNGERVKLQLRWMDNVIGTTDYHTRAYILMPIEFIKRMATAKSVEGKIGYSEFHFTRTNLVSVRKFLQALAPQG